MSNILKNLSNPPAKYRPIPFWAWNSKLETEESKRQVRLLEQAGNGGFFMHARGGLTTPFMGDEWMDNVKASIHEGEKLGISSWGYDENGWPSGFGDGRVNELGLEYQQKYLRMEKVAEPKETKRTIRCIRHGDECLHFYYEVNEFYVDTLSAEVTDKFIEAIYEEYKNKLGEDFSRLSGFFTDEPQVSRNGIPWSFILPDEYKKAYSEDLLDVLPDLFIDTETSSRTRFRFWHTVCELFADNFIKRIYDWCEKNGTLLTGHMVLEERLGDQVTSNGAVMPNYEFFHIPGMDWLARHTNNCLTPVQLVSVANQLDKKQILTETFACCGWGLSFEEMKWIYEWQMGRGVNLMCEHLSPYSMAGIRKRDYPAFHFYQSPWWDDYKKFLDYSSRIGMLIAEGKPEYKVLVLHTQSTAWTLYNDEKSGNMDIGIYNEYLMSVVKALEHSQIPFHLGDDRIIRRHGRIDENSFVIGTQSYNTVIVPPSININSNTLNMLCQFAENGGLILWCGEVPSLVDGEKSDKAKALAERFNLAEEAEGLIPLIPDSVKTVRVRLKDGSAARGMSLLVREYPEDKSRLVYIVNTYAAGAEIDISLKAEDLRLYDALNDKLYSVDYEYKNGEITYSTFIEEKGSLVLLAFSEKQADKAPKHDSYKNQGSTALELSGEWEIADMDMNALVLDYCDLTIDGEDRGRNIPVVDVQEIACAYGRAVKLEAAFGFDVKVVPEGEIFLVAETPELFGIEINGKLIEQKDCGYYRDKSFRKLDITGLLTEGRNTVTLKTLFSQSPETYDNISKAGGFESYRNKLSYDMEIDAVYILGNFGVELKGETSELPREALRFSGTFSITAPPEKLTVGELVTQKLPFFNGRLRYRKRINLSAGEIKNRHIEFARRPDTVTRVYANGKFAGEILWRPYRVSLDGLLIEGENIIEIETVGTLRNLLGPFHLKEEAYGLGPPTFMHISNIWRKGLNPNWDDAYVFLKTGLFFK